MRLFGRRNLDDIKEPAPFLISLIKVKHIRGESFLVCIGLQDKEKAPRQILQFRLGELSQAMQSRIRDVYGTSICK